MRIIYDIAAIFAVLFTPFWFIVLLCLGGIYLFPKWYEVLAISIFFELLFRPSLPTFMPSTGIMIPLAVYALGVLLLAEWLRRRIRQ